ncbi:MAG: alanine--tRNA ligase, partial [Pyrinomonadaceae bacterium]|nr:alanine--tRNA ligase [Pyrinomonadaceae bacterium]
RVVADHARATAFAIADGILPANEGRNYVLRKIMRRAIYQGRENLGFKDSFFHKVCNKVVDEMKNAYPELETQRDFIGKMVKLEEERFGTTMVVGLNKLDELLSKSSSINFRDLARLYDTYGTPIDLIFVVLNTTFPKDGNKFWTFVKELGVPSDEFYEVNFFKFGESLLVEYGANGVIRSDLKDYYGDEFIESRELLGGIDEIGFRENIESELKVLQQTSNIGKTKQSEKINPIYVSLERTSIRSTFRGYDLTAIDAAQIIALIKDDERVDTLNVGDEGLIVLNETPFYAESGGQVGDTGVLSNKDVTAKVFDTYAPIAGIILHKSKIERGSLKIGDAVKAQIDVDKRDATRRNHTATHLVHAALREVLGTHVKQAGSVVAPNYLRFDFSHYQPINDVEMREIEDLVMREILLNDAIKTDLMSIEEAMRTGAMALFGEKYGSQVRVVKVGDGAFSKELCGGTHARATGDIGAFKITSDEAVSSGVRRIRAITGFDAFARFRDDEDLIEKSLSALKTQRDNLPNAIERLQDELKKSRREAEDLKMKIASGAINSGSDDEIKEINGVKVIAKSVEGLDANSMRQLSDNLLNKLKSGVIILGRKDDEKVSIIVRVSADLQNKIKAGNIIKEIAPIVGGKGGGKPDMAEGGGNQPDKLNDALTASYGVIERIISAQ